MLMSCVNVAVFCFQPFFFFLIWKNRIKHTATLSLQARGWAVPPLRQAKSRHKTQQQSRG